MLGDTNENGSSVFHCTSQFLKKKKKKVSACCSLSIYQFSISE